MELLQLYSNTIKTKIPTPTRPLEYICLYPMEFPTQDGDCYLFLAVDGYSHFLFNTGIEEEVTDELILRHISLLLEEPNLISEKKEEFTLVLHKHEALLPVINTLLKPHNGKAIINDPYVNKIVTPVMEQLFENMYKKMNS